MGYSNANQIHHFYMENHHFHVEKHHFYMENHHFYMENHWLTMGGYETINNVWLVVSAYIQNLMVVNEC